MEGNGLDERKFIGEAVSRIYKEFSQIIKKKEEPSTQLGKTFHRKGNTNGPDMCEKMLIFAGNQGDEKLSTRLANNKSDNIKCWEGYRVTGTPVYIYDGYKTGKTTPTIIFCKEIFVCVYQEICIRKFTFSFVTAKTWK